MSGAHSHYAVEVLMRYMHRWVHRRVQSVSFTGPETIRRDISIDATVPWLVRKSPDDEDTFPTPLECKARKGAVGVQIAYGSSPLSANGATGFAPTFLRIPYLPLGFFRKTENADDRYGDPVDSGVLRNFDLRDASGNALAFSNSAMSRDVAIGILRHLADVHADAATPLIEAVIDEPHNSARNIIDRVKKNVSENPERFRELKELLDPSGEYNRFLAWLETFSSHLIGGAVFADDVKLESGDRLVVKYSYWERFKLNRPSAISRFGKALMPLVGDPKWSHHAPITLKMPEALLADSFHAEIKPPDGVRIQRSEFVVCDGVFQIQSNPDAESTWVEEFDCRLDDAIWNLPQSDVNSASHRSRMTPVLCDGPSHYLSHVYVNRARLTSLVKPHKIEMLAIRRGWRNRWRWHRSRWTWNLSRVMDEQAGSAEWEASPEIGIRVDLRPRVGQVLFVGMLSCLALLITLVLIACRQPPWQMPRGGETSLSITVILAFNAFLTGTYLRDGEGTFVRQLLLGPRIYLGVALMTAIAAATTLALGPSTPGGGDGIVQLADGALLHWLPGPSVGYFLWGAFLLVTGIATVRMVLAVIAALRPSPDAVFNIAASRCKHRSSSSAGESCVKCEKRRPRERRRYANIASGVETDLGR